MRTILSLLLALVLALSAALRAQPPEEDAPVLSAAALPEPDTEAEDAPAVSWRDMGYVHYDPALFYDGTDRLTGLAAGDDAGAVTELYDKLYGEYELAATYAAVAYIRYSEDVTDEYWTGEDTYCDALDAQMADALSTACHAVTQGPCAQAFAAHVGSQAAEVFAAYEPKTDRELELVAREAELVSEYYDEMAALDGVTYTYLGEPWDLDKLSGFPGASLASRDREGYLEVYYGLHRAVNDAVGPIFLELVSLRTELAQLAGYDSYTEYAYEKTYCRDYSPAQAQALCDQVKALAAGGSMARPSAVDAPGMTGEELTQALGRCAAALHPDLGDAWQRWTDCGLYSFRSGESAMAGAYTVDLPRYGCAFIYERLYGDSQDFPTLSHEFGHFANALRNPCPNLLTNVGSLDLMETHSNGMEALLTAYYDDIYGGSAGAVRAQTLGGLVASVADGCRYDEFQRRIYDDPDMTLDEINTLFADVSAQYGVYEPADVDYTWVYVLHNYEVPLYYISYAASALAALQLWDMARAGQDAAGAYIALLDRGPYGDGYLDTVAACGLRTFTEPGAPEAICRPVIEYLREQN